MNLAGVTHVDIGTQTLRVEGTIEKEADLLEQVATYTGNDSYRNALLSLSPDGTKVTVTIQNGTKGC